jgi:SAM-dependent methyltransferase
MHKRSSHKPYEHFASYWDLIAQENYEVTALYLTLFKRYKKKVTSVLELGCGTGFNLERIEKLGCPTIVGVDLSEAMLKIAKQRVKNVSLIHGDMTHFADSARYDFIFSANDSVNHLMTLTAWQRFFSCAAAHLAPNGVFIFDILTPHFYKTFSKESGYLWEFDKCYLHFSLKEQGSRYTWDVLMFERDNDQTYHLLKDTTEQRAVTPQQIITMLRRAGFKKIKKFSDYEKPVTSRSDRIYFECSTVST